MKEDLQKHLSEFKSISLTEAGVSLIAQRFDSKFIMPVSSLAKFLNLLRSHFSVLKIQQHLVHFYETLYFDTSQYKLYYDHHNEKPNRVKVRVRQYHSSGEVFFEVKHKFKGIKTGKLRLPQQKMMFEIGEREWLLIRQAEKTIHGLEPKLLTCFNRITLIHQTKEEKITIDTDLRFRLSGQEVAFNNCAILEIKTETSRPSEKVHEAIHALMLRQSPFSKYAIGVALLGKNVRANLFKPIILQLKKAEHG